MKRFAACLFTTLLLAPSFTFAEDDTKATETASDSTILFDGKNIDGWKGREDLWSVEDGQIVGRTTDTDPIDANTFLIWKGDVPEDFELTAWFKIESGNSGIQYRSKVVDEDKFIVGGYQADVDFTNKFAGILYEEKGRGILAQRGHRVTIGADGKKKDETFADGEELANAIHPGQWNEFRVVAKGNRLQHFINGTMTAEVIDEQTEKSSSDGVIALQLHRGPAMTVRFKNIALRK
ncbi:3-keto-disaccharide hydrolase [Novipirellula sp. SH528]|uniref:3-keto-disaccharide hydrolase n=1 Tax=Novipirellula sp. SH528 TaxID=3454466 RepID=UPI003F9F6784